MGNVYWTQGIKEALEEIKKEYEKDIRDIDMRDYRNMETYVDINTMYQFNRSQILVIKRYIQVLMYQLIEDESVIKDIEEVIKISEKQWMYVIHKQEISIKILNRVLGCINAFSNSLSYKEKYAAAYRNKSRAEGIKNFESVNKPSFVYKHISEMGLGSLLKRHPKIGVDIETGEDHTSVYITAGHSPGKKFVLADCGLRSGKSMSEVDWLKLAKDYKDKCINRMSRNEELIQAIVYGKKANITMIDENSFISDYDGEEQYCDDIVIKGLEGDYDGNVMIPKKKFQNYIRNHNFGSNPYSPMITAEMNMVLRDIKNPPTNTKKNKDKDNNHFKNIGVKKQPWWK